MNFEYEKEDGPNIIFTCPKVTGSSKWGVYEILENGEWRKCDPPNT